MTNWLENGSLLCPSPKQQKFAKSVLINVYSFLNHKKCQRQKKKREPQLK